MQEPNLRGIRLSEVDAHTYRQWVASEKSCVLLPVGAHEQHGAHLPMGTDAILSAQLAERVAARIDGRVAPPFTYGYKSQQKSGGGNHLPGSISLDAATLVSLTRSVVREFLRQGVKNVVLINGHFENYQFLYEGIDLALEDLKLPRSVVDIRDSPVDETTIPAVLLLSYWDYVAESTLEAVYPDGFPGWEIEHGGVLETSLMLHLQPELVRMDRAEDHPAAMMPRFDRLPTVAERTPASGCLSSPVGSDAEKGRLLCDQVVDHLSGDLASELDL